MLKRRSRALVSPTVFACHCCEVEEGAIQAEILVLDDGFQPGLHFLFDIDTEQRYQVQIESSKSPQYKVKLYATALHHAQAC